MDLLPFRQQVHVCFFRLFISVFTSHKRSSLTITAISKYSIFYLLIVAATI